MDLIRPTMIAAIFGIIFLGIAAVDAQILEKSYPIAVRCYSQGQLCEPEFSVPIETGSILQVKYLVPNHCSPIRLHIYVDGMLMRDTGVLGWPGATGSFSSLPLDTGFIDLGPVSPGRHTVSLKAEGNPGGCNAGYLQAWEGTLVVRTSPVDQITEKSYPIAVRCYSQGQLCEPEFSVPIETGSILQVKYLVPNHCSPIRLHIYVNGVLMRDTDVLGWPGATGSFSSLPLDTGFIDLGPVSPGRHTVSLKAEGNPGGCNAGYLQAWEGTLVVRTSL